MRTRSLRAPPAGPRPRSRGPPSVCAWSQATLLAGGATPQDPPLLLLGGPIPQSPLGGDPSPQTPLGGPWPPDPGGPLAPDPGACGPGSAAVEGGAEQAERRG